MWTIPAEAHLNSTGMGPFYDGLVHFLMSPEDIIPVFALALLAGLRGANYGRRALFVLAHRVAAGRACRSHCLRCRAASIHRRSVVSAARRLGGS